MQGHVKRLTVTVAIKNVIKSDQIVGTSANRYVIWKINVKISLVRLR